MDLESLNSDQSDPDASQFSAGSDGIVLEGDDENLPSVSPKKLKKLTDSEESESAPEDGISSDLNVESNSSSILDLESDITNDNTGLRLEESEDSTQFVKERNILSSELTVTALSPERKTDEKKMNVETLDLEEEDIKFDDEQNIDKSNTEKTDEKDEHIIDETLHLELEEKHCEEENEEMAQVKLSEKNSKSDDKLCYDKISAEETSEIEKDLSCQISVSEKIEEDKEMDAGFDEGGSKYLSETDSNELVSSDKTVENKTEIVLKDSNKENKLSPESKSIDENKNEAESEKIFDTVKPDEKFDGSNDITEHISDDTTVEKIERSEDLESKSQQKGKIISEVQKAMEIVKESSDSEINKKNQEMQNVMETDTDGKKENSNGSESKSSKNDLEETPKLPNVIETAKDDRSEKSELSESETTKRGRGRISKNIKEIDNDAKIEKSEGSESEISKKGRGRPYKTQKVGEIGTDDKSDKSECSESETAKKSRGRPHKTQKVGEIGKDDKSDKSECPESETAKKGRGRPSKIRKIEENDKDDRSVKSEGSESETTKRGRGRPAKMQSIEENDDEDDESVKSEGSKSETSKKSRGRPPKIQIIKKISKDDRSEKSESSESDISKRNRGKLSRTCKTGKDEESEKPKSSATRASTRGPGTSLKVQKPAGSNEAGKEMKSKPSELESPKTKKQKLSDESLESGKEEESENISKTSLRSSSRGKSSVSLLGTKVVKSIPGNDSDSSLNKLEPKLYNYFSGKYERILQNPEIRKQVTRSYAGNLRMLYRLLYERKFPFDEDQVKREILDFGGFLFKEKSVSYEKRLRILRSFDLPHLVQISKLLNIDVKVKMKPNIVDSIMKFLVKPTKTILSPLDPSDISLQPVVQLEIMPLAQSGIRKKKPKPSSNSTMKKQSSVDPLDPSVQPIVQLKKIPGDKRKLSSVSIEDNPIQTGKRRRILSSKLSSADYEIDLPSIMTTPNRMVTPTKAIRKGQASKAESAKISNVKLGIKKTEDKNLVVKVSYKKVPIKTPVKKRITISLDKLNNIKKEIESYEEDHETTSVASSEATLSAEEVTAPTSNTPRKRKVLQRVGKPLKTFPKIKESIELASFSSLQRLHILLFGASDKAENLKGNILAFGGFPFLEGTEEWKQKEFLLSLLALNTLREYLKILCIDYGEEDHSTLINKLMKFLAAPNDGNGAMVAEGQDSGVEIVSSEPVNQTPSNSTASQKKTPASKKKNAGTGKGSANRHRKVLMDEDQVRRLEADLAREQRILERERKVIAENHEKLILEKMKNQPAKTIIRSAPICQVKKPPLISKFTVKNPSALTKRVLLSEKNTPQPEQVQVLLDTVYKRRELKAAGVVISTPKKMDKTSLGDLPNIKFLVVTANYNDLDVLHHLIYMSDSTKSRVRKNILDFAGFGFNEDSIRYKERMEFLRSLGYDISKRIAFLLGLCPYKTDIPSHDLNELIMYFLMAPCKTTHHEVPIKDLPHTFFSKEMPEELCTLLQKHSDAFSETSDMATENSGAQDPEEVMELYHSPSFEVGPSSNKSARKSFKSTPFPSVKKLALSPAVSTLPLRKSGPLGRPKGKRQTIEPSPKKYASPSILGRSKPQSGYYVNTMPDGQQKTFQLVKVQPDNALYTLLKQRSVQPTETIRVQSPVPPQPAKAVDSPASPVVPSPVITQQGVTIKSQVPGKLLPSGIIIYKDNPLLKNPENIQNLVQTLPLLLKPDNTTAPVVISHPPAEESTENEEMIVPDDIEDVPQSVESTPEAKEPEVIHPLEEAPPTDAELYKGIQEVVLGSNFDDITLRNVIDKVYSMYPSCDLSNRNTFIKSSIKKIILGAAEASDSEY